MNTLTGSGYVLPGPRREVFNFPADQAGQLNLPIDPAHRYNALQVSIIL